MPRCILEGDFGERVMVVPGGERPRDAGERLSELELAALMRRWLAEPESQQRLLALHGELNDLAEAPVSRTRHQRDRVLVGDLGRRFETGWLAGYRVLQAQAPGGGRHTPGPQPPHTPGQPRPRDIVHPLLDIEPPVILVDRPHRHVARRRVLLATDVAFDGVGMFRCASDALRFYFVPEGGAPFDAKAGVTMTGAELASGVSVWAEGVTPSRTNRDVHMELALHGGSKRRGPPAHAQATVVDVRLDIHPAPGFPDGDARVPDEEKEARGAFVHVNRNTPDEHWALLVVAQPQPADFDGTLELRFGGARFALYREARGTGRVNDSPLVFPPGTIAGDGARFWLEGQVPGEEVLSLDVVGVAKGCERVRVQVVRFDFAESENQLYGFDDMDREPGEWPHVSVKSGGHTYVAAKLLGRLDPRAIHLATDNPAVASVPSPSLHAHEMDVHVDGAPGHSKQVTMLEARMNGPRGPRAATLFVHVYRELFKEVLMVRVEDRTSPGTKCGAWFEDLAAEEARVNRIFRQVVARVSFVPFRDAEPQHAEYDENLNGALDFDQRIVGVGEEKALLQYAGDITVAIVHQINLRMETAATAKKGAHEIPLSPEFDASMLIDSPSVLDTGELQEMIVVKSAHGSIASLRDPLKHDHVARTEILGSARGISGNPVMVEDIDHEFLIWAIIHELGHHMLRLKHQDDDPNNLMHHLVQRGARAQPYPRLRFKQLRNSEGNLESQWEKVPRPEVPSG